MLSMPSVISLYHPARLKGVETSTSRVTTSGCWMAVRSATPPPSEKPITAACSRRSVRISSAMASAMSSKRIGRWAAGERPCDCRSTPSTRRPAASASRLGPNMSAVPKPPCSTTSGEPLPRSWYPSCTPFTVAIIESSGLLNWNDLHNSTGFVRGSSDHQEMPIVAVVTTTADSNHASRRRRTQPTAIPLTNGCACFEWSDVPPGSGKQRGRLYGKLRHTTNRDSEGRFDRVEFENSHIGSLRRRKPDRSQDLLELITRPAAADVLFGHPDPNDVEGAISERAVVAQFAEAGRPAPPPDQLVRPVVRPGQLLHVAVKPCDQQCRHPFSPGSSLN